MQLVERLEFAHLKFFIHRVLHFVNLATHADHHVGVGQNWAELLHVSRVI